MTASTILVSFIVLSKIEFYETVAAGFDKLAESERLQETLRDHFRPLDDNVDVTLASGGTLGVCFYVRLSGGTKFLKTHLAGTSARANLAKEADILLRLYKHGMPLERFELLTSDGTARICLLMPELTPLATPMPPEAAAVMCRENDTKLAGHLPEILSPSWTLERHLQIGRDALAFLSHRGLLEKGRVMDLRRLIGRLEERLPNQTRQLCHGDFGPTNIMIHGSERIAIDWEDAFWGVAGYDYLYWLTFMQNRTFLKDAAFGQTDLRPDLEHAILALIVLLKSFLGVCSGASANHKLSVQSRIGEILDLRNH